MEGVGEALGAHRAPHTASESAAMRDLYDETAADRRGCVAVVDIADEWLRMVVLARRAVEAGVGLKACEACDLQVRRMEEGEELGRLVSWRP